MTSNKNTLNILYLTDIIPHNKNEYRGKYILDQISAVNEIVYGSVYLLLLTPFFKKQKLITTSEHSIFTNFKHLKILSFPRYHFMRLKSLIFILSNFRFINKIIKERKINLIHCHNYSLSGVAYYLYKLFNVPYFVTIHGREDPSVIENTSRKIKNIRLFLNDAEKIISVGDVLKKYLKTFDVADDQIKVIPNGISNDWIISKEDMHNISSLNKNYKNLISVSELRIEKGINYTIKALYELKNKFNIVFNYSIVGNGPEIEILKNMVYKFKIEKHIKFLGSKSTFEVQKELDKNDIFILPSWLESFGIAHAEAMARGKIAIGCRGEGNEAFIIDKKTGFLVEKHSSDAIVDILLKILDNEYELEKIEENAVKIIKGNFTWGKSAETLISLYNETVDKK